MFKTLIEPSILAAKLADPEWIVIDCRFDPSVQPTSLRNSLCRQIRDEAARLTAFPVVLAAAPDLDPRGGQGPRQSRQLIVHVEARLSGTGTGSRLIVSARPERLGLRRWRGQQTRPMPVALDWKGGEARIRGPVAPLRSVLAPPVRRPGQRPPFPVRSDET